MGISDRMKGLAGNVQEGVKSTTMNAFVMVLKLVTGLMIGLTLALIGQELIGYGTFALLFCVVVVTAVVVKILANWSLGQILIFDLICVLVAMLLRMYILVAP